MTETRSVNVSLTIRLDDILTGRQMIPDNMFHVSSGDGFLMPLSKNDGHFVFTGARPENIRIVSKTHETVFLPLDGIKDIFLRVAPIPVNAPGIKRFPLNLDVGESAHVGFAGAKSGYPAASALKEGALEISLFKEDYSDLTGLFHAVISQESAPFTVFVRDGLGYGRYSLSEPLRETVPKRGARFLPLYRVAGTGSTLNIPVPDDCKAVYVLRGDNLEKNDIC